MPINNCNNLRGEKKDPFSENNFKLFIKILFSPVLFVKYSVQFNLMFGYECLQQQQTKKEWKK